MNNRWVAIVMVVILLVAVTSIVRRCGKPATFTSASEAVEELSAPDDDAEARAAMAAISLEGERALDKVRVLYESAAPPPRPAEPRPQQPSAESDQPATREEPPPPSSPAEIKKAERRAFAVVALTSLPPTPKVVEAIVQTLNREPNIALRQNLANYLQQAAGFEIGVRNEDGSGDPGNDPAAWQRWWETEGRNRTSFNPTYGSTPPAPPQNENRSSSP